MNKLETAKMGQADAAQALDASAAVGVARGLAQPVSFGVAAAAAMPQFAQPVVDRDGQVYTDKGQATGWWFLQWPSAIGPRSLQAGFGMVEGVVRGVLEGANLVLTTRNGQYIIQVQHEGLEEEISIGWEISRLILAEQAGGPAGRVAWQKDFTERLQQLRKQS